MRLDLPDGAWAEVRERPTHAQVNLVRRALLRVGEDVTAGADVALAMVTAYVSAWSVRDAEGHEVPLDRAADAPDDVITAVAKAAGEQYRATPDPKGSTAPSGS